MIGPIGWSGVFQDRCRVNHLYATSRTGRSGPLCVPQGHNWTAPTGSQLRVAPDQRCGFFSLAACTPHDAWSVSHNPPSDGKRPVSDKPFYTDRVWEAPVGGGLSIVTGLASGSNSFNLEFGQVGNFSRVSLSQAKGSCRSVWRFPTRFE